MGKGQTRGRLIVGIAFIVLLGFAIYRGNSYLSTKLAENESLPIKAVQIDGVLVQLNKKQIADQVGFFCAGANLATLDLKSLQAHLLNEQWIAQIAVRRKMPDTLIVSVVEHVPAAYWNDNGLYDAKSAEVFYPDLHNFNKPLVRLGATRDNLASEVYQSAVKFINQMKGSKFQMISLYLDTVRCYIMTLANGTRLILGRGEEQAAQHLDRFLQSFAQTGLNIDEVEYIDLRYDVGFAVGKKMQTMDIQSSTN